VTTTAALYAGAAASVAQTWTTPTNAVGSTTGTYATFTSAVPNVAPVIEVSSFGAQAAVPSGSTINSVTVTVRHFVNSVAAYTTESAQLYAGATAKGTLTTMTRRTTVGEDSFVATGLTYADLADLRVRYLPLHSGTATTGTASLDRVGIVVDYSVPTGPPSLPILKEILVAGVDSGGNAAALTCTTASDTPATGSILVAVNVAAFDGAVATNPTTGTWTTRGTAPNPAAGSNSRLRVWSRAPTAGANTVTVNNGTSSYGHALIVMVWTNVDPTTPWDVAGSYTTSANNAYDIPALAMAAANVTEVCVYGGLKYGDAGVTGNISHPAGMAEKLDWGPDSAAYIIAGVAIATQSAIATSPVRTVAGSATGWAAAHFAIRGGTDSPGGAVEPIVVPDPTPTANPLNKWSTALGKRETKPADVLVIGDSITAGAAATTLAGRWVDKLLVKLRTQYPTPGAVGGQGYVSAYYNATFVDGWTFVGNYNQFAGYGWGHRSVQLSPPIVAPDPSPKALGAIERTVTGTSVDVQYLTFTDYGWFRVLVDGVEVATVNAATNPTFTDTGRLRVTFATRGSHVVRIEWLSGSYVFITGLMVYDQDENAGVHLTESGEGGATSAGWSPIDTPANAQLLQRVAQLNPQLVLIELGVNDWYTNIAPAAYKQNVQEIIQGIRDNTSPDPDFLLVGGYLLAQPGTNSAIWNDYINQMKALTNEQSDVSFVDLSQVASPGTAFGYSSTDNVHPTDAGHTLYAQMVYDGLIAVTPTPTNPANRSGQFFPFL
jgi:lysophospholipase L1-like esterase